MDSTENAHSALDAIDTVAFKVGLKGYNVDEVDEFLERLSVEVRQLKDLAHQQRQQLRQAAERISQLDAQGASAPAPAPAPAPLPSPIRTGGAAGAEQITSMIALAQRFIDQAQQEAEAKAREFTTVAQDRAREIVNEARSRAEDEVNRLNGLKQRLSEDVDTLAHQLQAERTRIAQVLAEFTQWVQTSLQAGGSKPAVATPAPAPAPASAPLAATPPPPAPPRPTQTPPPAPAPTTSQPTIGQVLKFDQTSRDDR
jgi:DivIVA domain-containing protein